MYIHLKKGRIEIVIIDFHMIFKFYLFFQTCKEGAQTTIYCAVSEDVKGESGKYYMDCKDYEHTIYISKQAYDEGLCKKVWEITERFTKLQQ